MKLSESKTTPMMEQWHGCKANAKDSILLFRMGDFYEAFHEDAELLSRELDLTLTKRQEVPMSGIPWHSSEGYIDRLLEKGYKVAIAEQTEDPKFAKGLVKREVIRILTPGSVVHSSLLKDKANNYFASISQINSIFGLAYVDVSTGECAVLECESEKDLMSEIFRLQPAEILTTESFLNKHKPFFQELSQGYRFLKTALEDWRFDHQLSCNFLFSHFKIQSLDGFGLRGMVAAINSAGALLTYLRDTLCHSIDTITNIQTHSISHYAALDIITQRNLELTEPLYANGRKNTLLDILDYTQTAMGGRLFRNWIKQPLLSTQEIADRQEAVETLLAASNNLHRLRGLLSSVKDVERLIIKISSPYVSPRDLCTLAVSFEQLPEIKSLLGSFANPTLASLNQTLDSLPQMRQAIRSVLEEEPPARLSDGRVVRSGCHRELDELKHLSADSKSWIARYQSQLREQYGIKTLKVAYNKMFGYYIEVSKGQTHKMPESFQRRQTLVNAERYLSPELKDYEVRILTAEEKISAIEADIFAKLRLEVCSYTKQVTAVGQALAALDCLCSLTSAAKEKNYIRPVIDESRDLFIRDGRHPIVESNRLEERFIPNDTILQGDKDRMLVITGPNMAGKSTYIRQTALLVIMAQIGSFIPASEARIGIVDKIFTRIGASDDLSRGQSTFMVEMAETANILHNATDRSLVILDEIGRGTSTYDGISIAWAVAEFLLSAEGKQAKTLFATHYWELTQLENCMPGAVNYHVAVMESEDHITFLRKIVKGSTDKSYGIHVARLAGMPFWVIERSKEILADLEKNGHRTEHFRPGSSPSPAQSKNKNRKDKFQMSFL